MNLKWKGLAITKAYLRVLGGDLSYEPNLPQGSVFRLILPKRRLTTAVSHGVVGGIKPSLPLSSQ